MGSLKIVTIVIDKNGVAMVELEEFRGKGGRIKAAFEKAVGIEAGPPTLVVNVERTIKRRLHKTFLP